MSSKCPRCKAKAHNNKNNKKPQFRGTWITPDVMEKLIAATEEFLNSKDE